MFLAGARRQMLPPTPLALPGPAGYETLASCYPSKKPLWNLCMTPSAPGNLPGALLNGTLKLIF